jgi:hypothetical protein
LAALAVLAIAASLFIPAGRHQWEISLFRQPTRYTALFFNHAGALPAAIAARQPLPVSFTVANHEGRPVVYKYILSAGAGRGQQVLRESTKAVPAGSAWTVVAKVRLKCRQCRIEVTLPGHSETIDFLVRVNHAGT